MGVCSSLNLELILNLISGTGSDFRKLVEFFLLELFGVELIKSERLV